MIWILLFLATLVLVLGPTLWVKRVMAKHGRDRPDLPGTGGELAEHLVARFELPEVTVEKTDRGDHYDPESRTVRLSPSVHDGRSLTAVAVAAHEVGHALQHGDGYAPLRQRQRLVKLGFWIDRIGSAVLFALSLFGAGLVSPRLLLLGAVAVVLMGLFRVAVHLITLPVELDASFNRALPILRRDGYLAGRDLDRANSVLKAAAWTYVASALMELLSLARFLRR